MGKCSLCDKDCCYQFGDLGYLCPSCADVLLKFQNQRMKIKLAFDIVQDILQEEHRDKLVISAERICKETLKLIDKKESEFSDDVKRRKKRQALKTNKSAC